MAYTFGGAAGDDATVTIGVNVGGDGSTALLVMAIYPTTLTAARCLWSFGVTRLDIAPTTSEVRFTSNNATTDGQWTTSGLGLVTNRYQLLAVLLALENTTVPGAVRVLIGNEETPPLEVAVTNNVVRSGNFTGGSNLTIGNSGSAQNNAFQGDIGWLSCINGNSSALNSGPLNITNSGVITDDELEHVRQRYIVPLWLGRPRFSHLSMNSRLATDNFQMLHWPATSEDAYLWQSGAGGSHVTFTVNATKSERGPFVNPPPNWPVLGQYVRR